MNALIVDENDIEFVNFVAYEYNKNSVSNLNKHKCYEFFKGQKENELVKTSQKVKKLEDMLGQIGP